MTDPFNIRIRQQEERYLEVPDDRDFDEEENDRLCKADEIMDRDGDR